jgi:serine/threonine-protein kinase
VATTRRFGLSLAARIFLTTALLIVLSVGTAVVVTSLVGSRIAHQAADEQLLASHSMQATSQQQRYDQLQLSSEVFANDSGVRGFIAEQANATDLLDLLEERRQDLRFDFAMVVNPQGKLLARTDQPTAAGADLSATPLVKMAIEKNQAAGVWQEGGQLYDAVAVPVTQDFILQGFVIMAYALNNDRALEVKRTSGSDVAYVASTQGGPAVAATTLDATMSGRLLEALRSQGAAMRQTMDQGQAVDSLELTLDGRPWMALLSPLRDATDKSVGMSVALSSLDRQLASYRRIQTVLLGVGLVSVLLAGALSFFLSRRAMQRGRQLAAAAEAARQGNYDVQIDSSRGDEVGKLARSFEVLLADLREKRDMEQYVADLSRTLPDSAGAREAAYDQPESRKVTLLACEMRGYANRRVAADPAATLDRLSRDLRRIASAVGSRRGRVEGVFGHRVLASFDGEGRSFRALAAATEMLAGLSAKDNAFDQTEPPAIAITAGEAVTGSVVWEDSPAPAVVGLPVQQLESLLREGTGGDLILSREVHDEMADSFKLAGVEVPAQRGVVSTQPLYVLRGDLAARVTGVELAPTISTAAQVAGSVAPSADQYATLAGIAPGQLLGERFQILSVLGAGGMGVVYKARDRELDDLVALKMLKREMADDAGLLERLKSELKLARKITHPNVLRTFDFGDLGGLPYISMEYVRGVTLRYLLDSSGRLPYSAGLRLAKQLCAGLGAAHAQGVIHRDIKPENLILDNAGNVKLMDFGIARPVKRAAPGQTQAGFVVGTPQYLSPEQLEGREVDQRADIYAVGVVLYEVFTGKRPFEAENPVQIILKHLNEPPAPPSTYWREIPPALERLILRCLEKDPAKRFANAGELLREVESLSA